MANPGERDGDAGLVTVSIEQQQGDLKDHREASSDEVETSLSESIQLCGPFWLFQQQNFHYSDGPECFRVSDQCQR